MSIFGLVIDDEKIAISPPAKHSSRVNNFLLLINGNLIDKIEFVVKLNYSFIFGHQIYILLGGWHTSSSNSILILSFDINFPISINSKNTALWCDY